MHLARLGRYKCYLFTVLEFVLIIHVQYLLIIYVLIFFSCLGIVPWSQVRSQEELSSEVRDKGTVLREKLDHMKSSAAR